MKNFREVTSSKVVRVTAGVVGALIVGLLIFHAGVVVGAHRNAFGEAGRRPDAVRGFRPPFFPRGFEMPHGFIQNAHGTVGTITAVSYSTLPTLTLRTREGTTEMVSVGTSTIIRNSGVEDAKALSIGKEVIVLGAPDSRGTINATLIRILSAPLPTPI